MGATVLKPLGKRYKDITGLRSGRLVAVRPVGIGYKSYVIWECKCDCGKMTTASSGNLGSGTIRSCGCLEREHLDKINEGRIKDPRLSSKVHNSWESMIDRCDNPKAPHYDRYGGRGIGVCDEWRDFNNFYDWAIANGHADGLTLERINNDGNYEPSNCRWATRKEQAQNRCTTHYLTLNGETHNMAEWADITGINVSTIHTRVRYGFPVEKVLYKGTIRRGYGRKKDSEQ